MECAFGILKIRWRSIFDKALELKIENSIKTIFAACVLHNICVESGDLVDEGEPQRTEEEYALDNNFEVTEEGDEFLDTGEAILFREELLQSLLERHV